MSVICPTVTAVNTHQFREQIERVQKFAEHIHIDMMDGKFVDVQSPGISQIWWPETMRASLHLMYQNPMEIIEQAIGLNPEMIIVHADADVMQVRAVLKFLKETNVKSGLAVSANTDFESQQTAELLANVDHVLIFSGNLGHHGGHADLGLTSTISFLNENYPDISLGWDGGINESNIQSLLDAGIEVFNVGGYIQSAENPGENYEKLQQLIK